MEQVPNPQARSEPTDNLQALAENDISAREAATLEEGIQSEQIAQARNESDEAGEEMERTTIIGAAAQGREFLLARLRQHSDKPKEVYVPPPMSARQLEKLELEMAAGKRAVERAEAQNTNRPVPPRDPREPGPSTPVHRPGNIVPDPLLTNTTGFAAGTKVYSPKA